MDYSHEDRLEALRSLYAVISDGEKDFYDAKEGWAAVTEDVPEEYFWMALEDSYRNDMLDIESGTLEPRSFELSDFDIKDQEWQEVTVSEAENMKSEKAPVYTEHFRRHDEPEFELGYPVSEMYVTRDVEKGAKEVSYTAKNNSDNDLWIRLDVSFKVPEFSPEVERLFDRYADDYLGKIWSDEMEKLNERAAEADIDNIRESSAS